MKEIKIYNTLNCHIVSEQGKFNGIPENYAEELIKVLANEDTDLAPDADEEEVYYSKLHSTKITAQWINNRLYGLCICMVDDNWTDNDTQQIKGFITGQYSDGWGESFEQHEICTFEKENIEHKVYISFWQSKGFKLITEEEFNAKKKTNT